MINFFLFGIPLLCFLFLMIIGRYSPVITFFQCFLIVFMAVVCSYFGNIFFLKSVSSSPNPGYSIVIAKSYMLFTTVVSFFFFGADISMRGVLAILFVLISSFFIIVDTKKNDKMTISVHTWVWYAIEAFFCFGLYALISKYLLIQNVPIVVFLVYIYIIATSLVFWEMKRKKIQLTSVSKKQHVVLFAIGMSSFIFSYAMQLSFDAAPNIGYVNAINTSSIAIITICSAFFFHDELTVQKFIGIMGVTVGLILLVL